MKSLTINRYATKITLSNIPIPKPLENQLLIKVSYAPINPADIYYTMGVYGVKHQKPNLLGMEGSGIVMNEDSPLKGKTVSFLPFNSFGSWAEYAICDKNDCFEIDDPIQGCMAYINPFTVLGFLHYSKLYSTVLFSSDRSAVAKMGIALFQKMGKKVFAISKEKENNQYIKDDGNMDNLIKNLEQTIQEPCIFFDSSGGDMSGNIFNVLQDGSQLMNYGCSSGKYIGKINPNHLIFKNKNINGFWMHSYYNSLNYQQKQNEIQIIKDNPQIFKTNIHEIIKINNQDIPDLQALQKRTRALGKLILQF